MHCVIETRAFASDAKSAGLSEDEITSIKLMVSRNPSLGEAIPGTGGARKSRFGAGGKGKRGGCRVIFFFAGDDVPVFLLSVFQKGERVDLSQAERNQLRQTLKKTAEAYRVKMAETVSQLSEKVG